MKGLLLLGAMLLAGCSSNTAWQISTATPTAQVQGASVHVHSSGDLTAVLGVAILAAGIIAYEGGYYSESNPRYAPEMDPARRVSEQDCTKPLDYSLGNIRCK
ncbi:MAG TPA: hypothetical protein VNP36_09760 [Burkholderiales bacterium]|nr:hypothetical protein [Burkholderiales bacterium]